MRIFKSEFVHSYKTYAFGYAIYAEKEAGDIFSEIYEQGFLPYTGAKGIQNTLYMARSARINLEEFSPNSENRRVLKKIEGDVTSVRTPLSEFNTENKEFRSFCLSYCKERHGGNMMPPERLDTVLNAGFITHIATYSLNDKVLGYVFEVSDDVMSSVWFSFYDTSYTQQSAGLWLMTTHILEAKERGCQYYYLGGMNSKKALYKTNFDALEYWDGNQWVKGAKELRELCKIDKECTCDVLDDWKRHLDLF
jgi:arginyl-tRNA--protein-N-Asp/Glu arginylyltransferase